MKGVAEYSVNQEESRADLVERHAPLVKRIACHLHSRLPPSVQLEDLVQAGVVGLLEAARNYDASQGASFATYAGIRIRGAMLDEIRRSDWTPRSVHRKVRMVAEAVHRIENEKGRDARDGEVAEALDMSLDEYHSILQDASTAKIFSYEDVSIDGDLPRASNQSNEWDPFANLQTDDFKRALAEAIGDLPERERLVVSLYYDEELNLREIGEVLGVTESRVCQIHGRAMIRLRSKMQDWLDREE
ncbi:MAG: RNA polymerase sigma factor FliA [Gammaproteobacteria bacterium]